jgi:sulfide:quinone oxidoreductase
LKFVPRGRHSPFQPQVDQAIGAMFGHLSRLPRLSVGAALTITTSSLLYGNNQNKISLAEGEKSTPRIVIVGGGTGGIGVAGMLKNDGYKDVTLIEPKDHHFYQPLWTLVGGGIKPVEESSRPMSKILASNTKWIQSSVSTFDPDNNTVVLSNGTKVPYDYLVVAVGIIASFDQIPGAVEALNDPNSGVVSVYDYNYAAKTAKVVGAIKEGERAIFTAPSTPV